MQGLDLVCKLFVGPGDLVAVESPTYTNGTATISGYEGDMLEVAGDADGMDVEALARLVGERGAAPKLIYTIPTFQNPSGTTLSLGRRERLIELAAEWGAVILEDDPYSLLRFEGEPLPSLRELGAGRVRVIAVHTFSKILAPGLRVGWVVAEPEVIARMIDARQSMDTCTAPPMQRLVARFLDEGLAGAHLQDLRVVYGERKRAMQQALADELGHLGAAWTDPHGGFFLWLTLPEPIDTRALFADALAEGVAFIPGPAFSISGRFTNALRLAFSAEPPDRARAGIRRLHRAIAQQLATT
jgi:2-aminoadipate transaminase